MRKLAYTITFSIIAYALVSLVKTELLFDFVDSLTSTWLIGIATVAIGYGITLIGTAATSRLPGFLIVMGTLFIFGGILTPIFGADNIRAVSDSIYGRDAWLVRMACVFDLFFYGLVAYALRSPREKDKASISNRHVLDPDATMGNQLPSLSGENQ